MISGFNTDVESEGQRFHVQSECHERAFRSLESIVFQDGEVVGVVEHSFSNSSLKNADNPEEILERRLANQHKQLVTVVGQGLVDKQAVSPPAETEPTAPPLRAVAPPRPRRIVWALALCVVGMLIGLVGFRLGQSSSPSAEPVAAVAPAQPVSRPAPAVVDEPVAEPVAQQIVPQPALPPVAVSLPEAEPVPAPEPVPVVRTQRDPPPPAIEEEVAEVAIEPVAQLQEAPPVRPAPVIEEPATPAVSRVVAAAPAPTFFKLAEGEYADLARVELAPQANHRPLPRYTRKAKKRREQGTVALDLLIDERGEVAAVEIREEIVESDLTELAVETARGWRFSPARLNGKPIRVRKPVELQFLIESGSTRVRVRE